MATPTGTSPPVVLPTKWATPRAATKARTMRTAEATREAGTLTRGLVSRVRAPPPARSNRMGMAIALHGQDDGRGGDQAGVAQVDTEHQDHSAEGHALEGDDSDDRSDRAQPHHGHRADQHRADRQREGRGERRPAHATTRAERTASTERTKAPANSSGTRKRRSLATVTSKTARPTPRAATLATVVASPTTRWRDRVPWRCPRGRRDRRTAPSARPGASTHPA